MNDTRNTAGNTFSSTVARHGELEDFTPDSDNAPPMSTTVAQERLAVPESEESLLAKLERLESARANKELVIEVYNKLVRHYLGEDRLEPARNTLERALQFAQKAYGERHPGVAPILIELAFVSYKMSDFEAAKSYLEPALAIQEKAYGKVSEQAAFVVHKLGRVNEALGLREVAEALYLRSVTTYQNTYSEDDSQIIIARADLSRIRRVRMSL